MTTDTEFDGPDQTYVQEILASLPTRLSADEFLHHVRPDLNAGYHAEVLTAFERYYGVDRRTLVARSTLGRTLAHLRRREAADAEARIIRAIFHQRRAAEAYEHARHLAELYAAWVKHPLIRADDHRNSWLLVYGQQERAAKDALRARIATARCQRAYSIRS